MCQTVEGMKNYCCCGIYNLRIRCDVWTVCVASGGIYVVAFYIYMLQIFPGHEKVTRTLHIYITSRCILVLRYITTSEFSGGRLKHEASILARTMCALLKMMAVCVSIHRFIISESFRGSRSLKNSINKCHEVYIYKSISFFIKNNFFYYYF